MTILDVDPIPAPGATPINATLVRSLEELEALCASLLAANTTIGFDVETGYHGPDRAKGAVSIDWDQQFVCGFSLTNSRSWARYVPVAHDFGPNLPEYETWEMMKPVLETLPSVAHNCFTGDTEFLVRDRGTARFEDLAGTVQEVWNGSAWVEAEIRSYGYAPVREVVLAPANRSRSQVRHTIWATSNHRWELRSGKEVTTDQLLTLPRLPDQTKEVVAASRLHSEPDVASEAFVHGLVFADGSLCSKQPTSGVVFRHQIRLCGWKAAYAVTFQSHTRPLSAHGDPVALHTSSVNMKALPENPDDAYVADFIEGWTLFDGTDRGLTRTLNTVDAEAAEWLVENAWRAGWLVTGHTTHVSEGFGKDTLVHYVQLSRDPQMGWRIVSVSEESSPVEVFCAEVVEGPERFTLAGGVLTGNSKFEIRNLRALARKGRGPRIDLNVICDSQIESYVLGRYQRHGLKALVKEVFAHDQPELHDLFAVTKNRMSKIRFNVLALTPEVVNYACEDAVWTWSLHQQHHAKIMADRARIMTLEMRILPLLCDMEDSGHAVDWDALREQEAYAQPFEDAMTIAARNALAKMSEDPETDYSNLNLKSAPQIRKALYGDLGLDTDVLTKKGEKSTGRIALEGLRRENPGVEKMLEVREVGNLKARLRKWVTDYATSHDGRVHANFNQTVVPSGRFSANDPSIQQLPKEWRWTVFPSIDAWDDNYWQQVCDSDRTVFGKHYWGGNFRDFLVAGPGCYLLSFDYCVAPETRLLTPDLRWVPASDIAEGDEVIGFDEDPSRSAKLRRARVEKTKRVVRDCFRVTFEDGSQVTASGDHLWVSTGTSQGTTIEPGPGWMGTSYVPGGKRKWVRTRDLVPGKSSICRWLEPWDEPTGQEVLDAAWLGGLLDGEGWIFGNCLGFAQVAGPVMEEFRRVCKSLGLECGADYANGKVLRTYFRGNQQSLKALALGNSVRLKPRAHEMWEGKQTYGRNLPPKRVVKIEALGDQEVVAIQTDTRTFIAEGLLSHNSQIELRVLAGLSQEPRLLEAFARGEDVHAVTAAMMLDRPLGVITKKDRQIGKAQPLTAKLLTPTGWTTMGAIQEGDTLIGSDGQPVKVTGVFPQGQRKVYRVTTTDGGSTECCGEHLWTVQDVNDKKKRWQTLPLEKILSRGLRRGSNLRWRLPDRPVIEFAQQPELPIDPYMLGLLLGDGTFRHDVPSFSSADYELIHTVRVLHESHGGRVREIEVSPGFWTLYLSDPAWRNFLTAELRALGLWGKRDSEKMAPASYLTALPEDRLSLLQGLLDTDGAVLASGAQFRVTSEMLARQVQELARSLGGFASFKSIGVGLPSMLESGKTITPRQEMFEVYLRLPATSCPFRLSRKRDSWKPPRYRAPQALLRVEEVITREVQCVSVSSEDGLYVTDDYIVTHNTMNFA